MNRFSLVAISLIVLAAISATASPNPSTAKVPAFPGTLANARYVYVASYDGDQFDRNLLPEDREAISAVQDSILPDRTRFVINASNVQSKALWRFSKPYRVAVMLAMNDYMTGQTLSVTGGWYMS